MAVPERADAKGNDPNVKPVDENSGAACRKEPEVGKSGVGNLSPGGASRTGGPTSGVRPDVNPPDPEPDH
jgi:hypothetical protein